MSLYCTAGFMRYRSAPSPPELDERTVGAARILVYAEARRFRWSERNPQVARRRRDTYIDDMSLE